jgi:predicted ester cyclase
VSVEQNKALVRRFWNEAWNKGNLAVIDELVAPDYIRYGPGVLDGERRGLDALKRVIQTWRSALPDLEVGLDSLMADGDEVVCRIRWAGHHRAELLGMAPTGKEVRMWEIQSCRVAGGKIVEFWAAFDRMSIMSQLGKEAKWEPVTA